MLEQWIQWELGFLHSIQESATPLWDFVWTSVTMLGESGLFWIALSLFLMFLPRTRKCGFSMGIALALGAILVNVLLKNVVARPRPYDLDPTLSCRLVWGEMTRDFSFPSGHTAASFEAAFALFLRNRKWGVIALTAAFFIGVSRLFLVVHYPSDVVAGAVIGMFCGYLGCTLVDAICSAMQKKRNTE